MRTDSCRGNGRRTAERGKTFWVIDYPCRFCYSTDVFPDVNDAIEQNLRIF